MNIKQLLTGIKYSIDDTCEPDIDKSVNISLIDENIDNNTLLFLTEKVNQEKCIIDIKELTDIPYALVANEKCLIHNCTIPIIRVKNVREAYAYSLSNYYEIDYNKLKIIGVTGTNGKTTTATIIYEILKYAGYSVGFIGTGKILINDEALHSDGYSMTTPDPTILYKALSKMQKHCNCVVMEVSSHSIALRKTTPINFEYCLFTNLSPEHMDFHKSMNEYYLCKLNLFKSTRKALFNLDDAYSRKAYMNTKCNKDAIGIIQEAETYATDISTDSLTKINFYYRAPNIIFPISINLGGAFNVYNVIMAVKCALDLGIKPCIAKEALLSIKGIEGRMQAISRGGILAVIDYAHTPYAFDNCLNYLFSIVKNRQKLILVFGCGGNRDKSKRAKMGAIASKYSSKVIITEDNNRNESFTDIICDIIKGMDISSFTVVSERKKAIEEAVRISKPGDIIAVIGKGHEKYSIRNGSSIPFDEEIIIKDALELKASADES